MKAECVDEGGKSGMSDSGAEGDNNGASAPNSCGPLDFRVATGGGGRQPVQPVGAPPLPPATGSGGVSLFAPGAPMGQHLFMPPGAFANGYLAAAAAVAAYHQHTQHSRAAAHLMAAAGLHQSGPAGLSLSSVAQPNFGLAHSQSLANLSADACDQPMDHETSSDGGDGASVRPSSRCDSKPPRDGRPSAFAGRTMAALAAGGPVGGVSEQTVVSVDTDFGVRPVDPSAGSKSTASQNSASADHTGRRGSGVNSSVSPQQQCAVCGDISSGKHYGILACNGCSGFFKRSVRRKLIYRCQAGTGACLVDRAHRNQCQACRLKRCLLMGMNKEAVQNERQPRNTATIRAPAGVEINAHLLRQYAGAVSAAVDALAPIGPNAANPQAHQRPATQYFGSSLKRPASDDAGHTAPSAFDGGDGSAVFLGAGRGRTNPDAFEEHRADASTGTALAQLRDLARCAAANRQTPPVDGGASAGNKAEPIQQNASQDPLCGQRELVGSAGEQQTHSPPGNLSTHASVYDTSARLLGMAVKWARALTAFGSLPAGDQWTLLTACWPELFLLSVYQWSMPMDQCPLMATALFGGDPASADHCDITYLQQLFERVRGLRLNSGEFACLKAMALFRPECGGLTQAGRVRVVQEQALGALVAPRVDDDDAADRPFLADAKPDGPSHLNDTGDGDRCAAGTNGMRLGQVLLTLSLLRIVPADRLEKLFFAHGNAVDDLLRSICLQDQCA